MNSVRKQAAVRTEKRGETRKIRNLTEKLSRDEYRLGFRCSMRRSPA